MITQRTPLLLIVSRDTEEDNWNRSRKGVTVRNIRELRRLARFFDRLGVRPTYFTTYHVAIDPDAAAVVRDVGDESRGEIGAHLHPWNTPPFFFQAEDGIRDWSVTGVQTCALPISAFPRNSPLSASPISPMNSIKGSFSSSAILRS